MAISRVSIKGLGKSFLGGAMRSYLAVFGLFGAIAVAASAGTGGFQGPRAVVGCDVGDTDLLYIRFADAGSCRALGIVPKGKPYYNDMLAMTISAYNASKPLNVYFSTCPDDGRPAEIVRMVHGAVF